MTPKVVAFVQARMSSRRLPAKVLAPIAGEPMLARVLSRTCQARTVAETWVLTSEDESDEPIEKLCKERGIPCFRGSLDDVLDRFVQAAQAADPDIIVRITADCPAGRSGLDRSNGGSFAERPQNGVRRDAHVRAAHLSRGHGCRGVST